MIHRAAFLLSVAAFACAAPSSSSGGAKPAAVGEELLEEGGELVGTEIPAATVQIIGDEIVVWGVTEVPGNSRMQAALAMVDSITRAELLKALQVNVASLSKDIDSTEGQRIVVAGAEAVNGTLSKAGPMQHGWKRVLRDGEEILRLRARLVLPRSMVHSSLAAAIGDERAGKVVNGLGGKP